MPAAPVSHRRCRPPRPRRSRPRSVSSSRSTAAPRFSIAVTSATAMTSASAISPLTSSRLEGKPPYCRRPTRHARTAGRAYLASSRSSTACAHWIERPAPRFMSCAVSPVTMVWRWSRATASPRTPCARSAWAHTSRIVPSTSRQMGCSSGSVSAHALKACRTEASRRRSSSSGRSVSSSARARSGPSAGSAGSALIRFRIAGAS